MVPAYTLAAGRESGFPTLRYDLIEEKAGWSIKMLYTSAGEKAFSASDDELENFIYRLGHHPKRLMFHPSQRLVEGMEEHRRSS